MVARRILQMGEHFNRSPTDSDYIWIRSYNSETGELLALCTNNSVEKVQTIIQKEVKKTAKELNEIVHRHFYLKHYDVWVCFI